MTMRRPARGGADQNLPRLISKELEIFTAVEGNGERSREQIPKEHITDEHGIASVALAQGAAGNQKASRGPGAKKTPWAVGTSEKIWFGQTRMKLVDLVVRDMQWWGSARASDEQYKSRAYRSSKTSFQKK